MIVPRPLPLLPTIALAGVMSMCASRSLAAPNADALKFFENEIRPLLANKCQECHGPKKKKSGLRLDNLAYILQGGEGGAAIVKGDPDKSLLMEFVSYKDSDHEMPPDGKLPDKQIAALKQWIAMGAPWPEAEVASAKVMHKPGTITDDDRKWWSYQPVRRPEVPAIGASVIQSESVPVKPSSRPTVQPSYRPVNAIDHFVLDRLNKEGLKPAPEASRTELIRRLSFDLHGLPPTPEQVKAFVEDKRPDAYEILVDAMLASPRFGERQAQHWLDLTRYAESEGYRLDSYRPNVWPYRDYVIKSFNDDKPYNQFMREQIAGDEIAPDDPNVTVATAFLRQTAYEYNQRDAEGQWRTIMNEVTDVTSDVFLGTSLQCAQCHDHKFDPLLQKDYYRLQAFLNNITWAEDKTLATPEQRQQYQEQLLAWEAATVEPRSVIDSIIEPRIQKLQKSAMEKFPAEVFAMYQKPREQRTPYEEQIVQLAWRQAEYERVRFKEEKMKSGDVAKLAAARAKLAEFDHLKPKPLMTGFVIGETGPEALPATFKTRKVGSVTVNPGFITILDPTETMPPVPPPGALTSGRRTVLANWLARPDNPLTTRVMVNRIWQHHFGRGIVGTASDFGRLGDKPTHPELLDWLTSEFIKGGWHMKPLHKMILMSQTYRQTARIQPSKESQLKDPDNRLLWRFSPHRLDAEQARDAVLAASGELKPDMGGEGVPASTPKRSIYTKKIRNTQDDFLRSLDAPAGFQSIAERQSTTTATQSLLLINGDWPLDRSRAMAANLLKSKPKDDTVLVQQAYLKTYSRDPSKKEAEAAVDFLRTQRSQLRRETMPPQATASPLADASKVFGPANASKTTKTLMMKPGTVNEKLRVNLQGAVEPNSFAIEAVVKLDSVYPDASVRTIASRWNNAKTEPGWCFGVTSAKSAFKPNNLILQLSGDDFQGTQLYEVIDSNLVIHTGKPYYVAAAIENHPAEGQQFGGTVTFYARDLSDPAAPMQSATVNHQVCGGYISPQRALYIGGRETDQRSLWDGAIARVVLRKGALDSSNLMTWASVTDPNCVLDVNADQFTAMQKAPPAQSWSFETSITLPKGSAKLDANTEAVTDLCHALLNSNEFFYLQ